MHKKTFLTHFLFYEQKKQIRLPLKVQQYQKAAVLIALVERHNELYIILTKRALHLNLHPGQISFPGGKFEDTDNTLQRTALREAEEEIGILKSDIQVLGQLNKAYTLSGFEISPFIAFIKQNYTLRIDPLEVESVFELPLAFLLNEKNIYAHTLITHQQCRLNYCINYQDKFIWGATAQILKNLQQQLLA